MAQPITNSLCTPGYGRRSLVGKSFLSPRASSKKRAPFAVIQGGRNTTQGGLRGKKGSIEKDVQPSQKIHRRKSNCGNCITCYHSRQRAPPVVLRVRYRKHEQGIETDSCSARRVHR